MNKNKNMDTEIDMDTDMNKLNGHHTNNKSVESAIYLKNNK
jgi:hypothetical protein